MDKIKQLELIINKLNIKQKIKIIDDYKDQYSIRNLSQYLKLNLSTYYFLKNKQKPIKKEKITLLIVIINIKNYANF